MFMSIVSQIDNLKNGEFSIYYIKKILVRIFSLTSIVYIRQIHFRVTLF